jgi:sec-independent protein translocase protein TatB
MFGDLSMGHIMIIAVIALIVLGPEKFPEYAKIALRAYRDFRGYVDGIKRDMADELRPVRRELSQLARYNPEDYIEKLTEAVSTAGNTDKPKDEETTTGQTVAGETTEAVDTPAPAESVPTPADPVPTADAPTAETATEEQPTPQTPETVGDFEMYSAKGYEQPKEEEKKPPSSSEA